MTTHEAAAVLGIAARSVWAAIARGKLPATRRGRDWWIEQDDVARYAAMPKAKGGRPKKETPQ